MTSELELKDMIAEAKARLDRIRADLSKDSTMKYALESLPELIGEQDFKDLCLMFKWHDAHGPVMSGEEFARRVRDAAFTRRHQAQSDQEQRRDHLKKAGLEL